MPSRYYLKGLSPQRLIGNLFWKPIGDRTKPRLSILPDIVDIPSDMLTKQTGKKGGR